MNKSLLINSISIILIIISTIFTFNYSQNIFLMSLFALSGSITNQVAIYMLFDKVPFLYGSGVVENRFEDFKKGIYDLMMNQFFTQDNIELILKKELSTTSNSFNFENIISKIDFTIIYNNLKNVVMNSPLGGMLAMFGGEDALKPLEEPFIKKIKESLTQISNSDIFQKSIKSNLDQNSIKNDIHEKVSHIITKRLDELTPKMVKNIIQDMIKKHLGWLVVWGGVFGGLIGLISSFII